MDCAKTGALIARLRKEKGLTQKSLAEALGLSNKTISKWECGLGCPDLSLWPSLSALLGVDIVQMMEGEIISNQRDIGNIRKALFYVCPVCGNILVSTGSAGIFCCGRKTEALAADPAAEKPALTVEESDNEYYVTIDHPMEKDHYLAFAALVQNDRITLVRFYPEQNLAFRLPYGARGKLYVYCTRHGMMLYPGLR